MKHALFVAFHYPPEASSSGVLRTLKYTRYLAENGWRVTVLTLNRDAYEITDAKLEEQIPSGVRVVRTPFLNTKRHLSIKGRYLALMAVPDSWIGWYPWAVAAGRRIIAEDPVDLVYSTSPHATAHLIARSLARHAHKPWVMDFRDPWFEEPPEPGTPAIVHYFARRLERSTIAAASRVVASTPQLRDLLSQRYPECAGKISAILNGYDEADFAALPEAPKTASEVFTLVHAGNINAEFRDPRPLFLALRRAADRGELDASKIRLRFIGGGVYADSNEIKQCLNATRLAANVTFVPRIPYEASLQELMAADMLLLLQASEDTRDLVPAKLYEYLRAQRPVLALVLPGASGQVMQETGGGWAVDPGDATGLDAVLTQAYRAWADGSLSAQRADLAVLRQYDRRSLTAKLAQVFDTLSSSR